jgi:hypothetical protein
MVLSVFGLMSFGQTDFCLPGATWVYYQLNVTQTHQSETKVTYVGDTIISPYQSVKILKEHLWQNSPQMSFPIYTSYSTSYFAQENDSVMELIEDVWELVFDYGAEAGDTRVVYIDGGECSSHDTMRIESIDTISFQGMELRRYNYQFLIDDQLLDLGPEAYPWNSTNGSYLEKVGFRQHSPLGEGVNCMVAPHTEYLPLWLTCYTDDEILENGGQPCSLELSVASALGVGEAKVFVQNNHLQIKNAPNSTLRVYDILGKELLKAAVLSDNETFDIGPLPNGVLVAVVESQQGAAAKKLINISGN